MLVCLGGVHALRLMSLHSQVCGGGVALQRYNLGSGRRRRRRRPFQLFSFASENFPISSQGSKDSTEARKGSSKDFLREETSQRPHSRWWYGKDGELESTFPCPDCRGRGYIVCPLCDIATPDSSCTECHGTGLKTCSRCQGNRAILLQPVYEGISWEENTTRGPLLDIQDDDVIDEMDIDVVPDRKSKRIYGSPSPEVREKIRQALKSLDARTGSVTRRMRRIHNDPVLNAKRIAGIKVVLHA
ncbi:hypothetical protein L7F22_065220 [Adiantum nelumboides]|nr:hypothetical protein [Adiantum nelumboides]